MCYQWKCTLVQPLWKTVWRSLRKLKIELLYDLAILLLSVYMEKTETLIQKKYMHLDVHGSIIYSCQGIIATSVSINR